MEGDDEGELEAREQYGVEVHFRPRYGRNDSLNCRSEFAHLRHQLAFHSAASPIVSEQSVQVPGDRAFGAACAGEP